MAARRKSSGGAGHVAPPAANRVSLETFYGKTLPTLQMKTIIEMETGIAHVIGKAVAGFKKVGLGMMEGADVIGAACGGRPPRAKAAAPKKRARKSKAAAPEAQPDIMAMAAQFDAAGGAKKRRGGGRKKAAPAVDMSGWEKIGHLPPMHPGAAPAHLVM